MKNFVEKKTPKTNKIFSKICPFIRINKQKKPAKNAGNFLIIF